MFIFTRFSTYERKLNLLILRFKKVYIHLPCTMDGGGATILNPEYMITKEKSVPTVNIKRKSVLGEGL